MLSPPCVAATHPHVRSALRGGGSGLPLIINTGSGIREGLGQKFNIPPWNATERFCLYQLAEQAFKLTIQKSFLFDFSWEWVTSVFLSLEVLLIQKWMVGVFIIVHGKGVQLTIYIDFKPPTQAHFQLS